MSDTDRSARTRRTRRRGPCPSCGGPILQITNRGDGPIAHPCGHRIALQAVARDDTAAQQEVRR